MAGEQRRRYPWRRWFRRKGPVKVVQYEDYDCQPHSMAQQFRNAAMRFGLRLHVEIDGSTVTVRRVD